MGFSELIETTALISGIFLWILAIAYIGIATLVEIFAAILVIIHFFNFGSLHGELLGIFGYLILIEIFAFVYVVIGFFVFIVATED